MIRALLLVLSLLVLAVPAPAAQTLPERERDAVHDGRARWAALTPEQRARAQERFEALRTLAPEERRAFLERARALQLEREQLRENLRDEGGFGELPSDVQDEVVDEELRREARERALALRDVLSRRELRELEGAPWHSRPWLMERFCDDRRERASHAMIDKLAALEPERRGELVALRELPLEERCEGALAELRGHVERTTARAGKPPRGVTSEQWASWRELPDGRFLEQLYRHARPSGPHAFGPPRWRRGQDHEALLAALSDEERQLAGLLAECEQRLVPTLEDRHELRHLSPSKRSDEMLERVRQRVLELLEANELMDAEELRALERERGEAFVQRVREWVRGRVHEFVERHGIAPWEPFGAGRHGGRGHRGGGRGPERERR